MSAPCPSIQLDSDSPPPERLPLGRDELRLPASCHRRRRRHVGRDLSLPLALRLVAAIALLLVFAACNWGDARERIRWQQRSGDFAATVEPLRELLAESPGDPELNYLYGLALVRTGQIGLASWPLRRALEDPDWLRPAGLQLAELGLTSQDFNEVVEVTTRILEVEPDDPIARLYRAQAHAHWKKDAEAALADARQILETSPGTLEAYEPLILALLALGRQEEASQALDEAGERLEELGAAESQRAWHCSTTAIFAQDADDLERARALWEQCLEQYPGDPTVVTNAVTFFDGGYETERSLEALRRAVEHSPDRQPFRVGLAARLRQTGRADEGEAILREATEVDDPQLAVGAMNDLARFLQARGAHDQAAETFGRAIDLVREQGGDPGPGLRFAYADALVVSGQLEQALEVAEAISVPAQRRLIRGRVAQEQGDPARALQEFDEALRLWPDNAVARYYAARAAEKLGDFDRALEEYRYSIRTSVGATDARTRGAKLLIAEGRARAAYQLLFLEVAKAPLEPEGELFSMYLMGRVANPKQLHGSLSTLAARRPALLPHALVRGAEGVAESAGAKAALSLLTSAPGLDLGRPENLPVLRAIVGTAHAAGHPEVAADLVARLLEVAPDSAVFHAMQGLHRERGSQDARATREAYEEALRLDGLQPDALAGLGRLWMEEDAEKALDLFDRAVELDASDVDSKLGAARALQSLGRHPEAVARLEALLEEHPFEVEAARLRVEIDLAREQVTAGTLESARRATRFGRDPVDYESRARVEAALGETDAAEKTRAQLQRLRELQAEGAAPVETSADPEALGDGQKP